MFADRALAARIEHAEARLSEDVARSVQRANPEARVLVLPIADGLAVYGGPASPINKVIGIGLDGPLDAVQRAEVEEAWRARGEPVRVELSILADPVFCATLSDRGYRLHGFENVLGRTLEALEEPSPRGVSVELLHDRDRRAWLDIAVAAFLDLDGTGSVADDALPRAEMERVLLDFATAPGFTRYLARIDGRPVGEAVLRIDGRLAQMAGAGTLPSFRGRGVQKALVHRRLADARGQGCDLAVVTTSPGTRSQENVMRRGFQLLYTRAILIKN
jgi:GNAT superfamily N-acetyltransferase